MGTSVYDFTVTTTRGETIALEQYRGRPMLLVNTASKCGFTGQYSGLQQLHEQYGPKGLVVIGFPCDQFAHQEPGDEESIEQFCTLNFGVTFPLSRKIEVNGSGTDPLFAYLRQRAPGRLGSAVKWNFTKFLVAPDGSTVKRYSPQTEPEKLAGDIEGLLGQSVA